jgi:hypothetical protein
MPWDIAKAAGAPRTACRCGPMGNRRWTASGASTSWRPSSQIAAERRGPGKTGRTGGIMHRGITRVTPHDRREVLRYADETRPAGSEFDAHVRKSRGEIACQPSHHSFRSMLLVPGIRAHQGAAADLRLQLTALDAATKPDDLAAPGWRLHPLTGNLKGFFSITVKVTGGSFSGLSKTTWNSSTSLTTTRIRRR